MLSQKQQLKILQKLSPQQIQLMRLFQVPAFALEQRIKDELEANPALEEGNEESDELYEDEFDDNNENEDDSNNDDFSIDDYISDDDVPEYRLQVNNTSKDDKEKTTPLSIGQDLYETLYYQLGLKVISEKQIIIGKHIIGNIDESGYLTRDLYSISDDLAFSQNIEASETEINEVLEIVQSFDPSGIGARNLNECLLIQLHRKEEQTKGVKIAISILENYFDDFVKKHYEKIISRLNITEENLKEAIAEILKLNPKPGNTISNDSKSTEVIIPDFIINVEDGEIEVSLTSRNVPDLRVNSRYNEMLHEYNQNKTNYSKDQKNALLFVKQKIESAKWFIDAIKQRYSTLMAVMTELAKYQKAYFVSGDETKIKPMILKDLAELTGLDISTISRVTSNKYVQTPYGTFLLKSFFSESLHSDNGEVSTIEVKEILKESIKEEDKLNPLTDEKLVELLKLKGYNLARRTIAKYREQIGIPVARLRKEL